MNTEDDEFERIQLEIRLRRQELPEAIPFITEEEWQALNEISET
jgi:hypothetical protein